MFLYTETANKFKTDGNRFAIFAYLSEIITELSQTLIACNSILLLFYHRFDAESHFQDSKCLQVVADLVFKAIILKVKFTARHCINYGHAGLQLLFSLV